MTIIDNQKRLTIQQLFIIVGLLVLVLAFFSKQIIKEIEAPFLHNIMELEGKNATELLANASVDAIISQDIPYLETIVTQTGSQNSNIISIQILSDEDTPLVEWTEEYISKDIQKRAFSKKVILEEEYFGKIILHWRTDLTLNKIDKHASYLSYIFVLITAFLVLFYLLMTHIFVIRPIQALDSNLNKLNKFFQQGSSGPIPKMEVIGSFNSIELHNLINTVKIIKALWVEKAQREKHLIKEVARRKAVEIELQKHRDSLQLMVEEKTKNLTHALEVAEDANINKAEALVRLRETQEALVETEKMASLGALVAGVGHEVNTPLGIVKSAISIIENDIMVISKKLEAETLTRHDLGNSVSTMQNATNIAQQSTLRIINLMNTFKQIAVDQTVEEETKFDIDKYIQNIMDTLISLLKQQGITYNIKCPEALQVKTIPGVLAQIFTNLVNNSIKHGFTNHSEGAINIELKMLSEKNMQIIYRDNGTGMDTETLKHVFEPFYTTARNSGGTGLGMSIVFNLVTQKLKGTIDLTSQLGEGMTCVISIPVN